MISSQDWLWVRKISVKHSIPMEFLIGLFSLASNLNHEFVEFSAEPLAVDYLAPASTKTDVALDRFHCGITGMRFSAARSLGYSGGFLGFFKLWVNLKYFGLFLDALGVNNVNTVLEEFKKISTVHADTTVREVILAAKKFGPVGHDR